MTRRRLLSSTRPSMIRRPLQSLTPTLTLRRRSSTIRPLWFEGSFIDPDVDIEKADHRREMAIMNFKGVSVTQNGIYAVLVSTLGLFFMVSTFLACYHVSLLTSLAKVSTQLSPQMSRLPILASLGEIEKLAWVGIGFPMGSVALILLIGTCLRVIRDQVSLYCRYSLI